MVAFSRSKRKFRLTILAAFLIPPIALAQTVHGVKLTWNYTQGSDSATGFNAYRGTTPGGPYIKLNATPLPSTTLSYLDITAHGGAASYYVVTAIDAAGNESVLSPEAAGTMLEIGSSEPTIGGDDPNQTSHRPSRRKRSTNPPVK